MKRTGKSMNVIEFKPSSAGFSHSNGTDARSIKHSRNVILHLFLSAVFVNVRYNDFRMQCESNAGAVYILSAHKTLYVLQENNVSIVCTQNARFIYHNRIQFTCEFICSIESVCLFDVKWLSRLYSSDMLRSTRVDGMLARQEWKCSNRKSLLKPTASLRTKLKRQV